MAVVTRFNVPMAARSSLSTQHRFGYIVAMLDLPSPGVLILAIWRPQKPTDVMLATKGHFSAPPCAATNP